MSLRRTIFDTKVRLAGGGAYRCFLRRARHADSLSRDELLRNQRVDADALARFAAAQSPWYRERIGPLLQHDLTDPAVFERIPVLEEKEDLRDHYDEIVVANSGVRRTRVARTGGSTGQPLKVLKDSGALDDLAGEFHGALPVAAELVETIAHVRGKQKSVVSHLPQA